MPPSKNWLTADRFDVAGVQSVKDPERPQRSHRKVLDRSIALVFSGVLFLLPPIAGVALIDERVFELPIPLVYVFLVWALLIAGAAFLAPSLRALQSGETADDRNEPAP